MTEADIDVITWIIRLTILGLLALFAWGLWQRHEAEQTPDDRKPPKPSTLNEDDWL